MEKEKLQEKIDRLKEDSLKVRGKSKELFEMDKLSGMLKNEYKNKVNQYDNMYDSVETMKQLSSKPETTINLLEQQVEILTVQIKWELDWTKRAISSLN